MPLGLLDDPVSTHVRAQNSHSIKNGTIATTRLKNAIRNLELSGTITVVQKNLIGTFGEPIPSPPYE